MLIQLTLLFSVWGIVYIARRADRSIGHITIPDSGTIINYSYPTGKRQYSIWIPFTLFCLITLALFAGVRGLEIGKDTGQYARIFSNRTNLSSYREVGFGIYNSVMRLFTNDYTVYCTISALIPAIFIYKASTEYNIPYELVIFLYIASFTYVYSFNIMRQIFAIAIVVYSYKYLISRNIVMFSIFSLIAISFHNTAMIILPLYFVCYGKLTVKKGLLITVMGFCVIIFTRYQIFIQFMRWFLNIISPKFASYYMRYFYDTSTITETITETRGTVYVTIFYVCIFLVLLFFRKNVIKYREHYDVLLQLLLFGLFLRYIPGVGARFENYLYPTVWFLFPILLENIKAKKEQYLLLYGSVVSFYTLYFMFMLERYSQHNFLNYTINIYK